MKERDKILMTTSQKLYVFHHSKVHNKKSNYEVFFPVGLCDIKKAQNHISNGDDSVKLFISLLASHTNEKNFFN